MKTFKIIKKLESWFLVQELILTKQGETLVEDLQKNGMSEEGIASILLPYDATKKTQSKDKNLVSCLAQYYKKDI